MHKLVKAVCIPLWWHTAHRLGILRHTLKHMFRPFLDSKHGEDINNPHKVNLLLIRAQKPTIRLLVKAEFFLVQRGH